MSTEDQIINEELTAMLQRTAGRLQAEAALTGADRARATVQTQLDGVMAELQPLLKNPSFNGKKIHELQAQHDQLVQLLGGGDPGADSMLVRGTVSNPTVIRAPGLY